MKTSRRPIRPPVAMTAALLLAVGCGKQDDRTRNSSDHETPRQGLEGFFDPRPGETWKYKVQREIPLEVELSEEDATRRPERTESGHLITFERVRTCTGTTKPKSADRTLTSIDITENGVHLGRELYDISSDGIFSKGWIGAGDAAPEEFLERGIALANPKMQPGDTWKGSGRDPSRQFFFRVIERTTVSVPAGRFLATRIQVTMDHDDRSLTRTIWFANKVGIIKEETVAYGSQRTRVRERSELVHWRTPGDFPPDPDSPVPVVTSNSSAELDQETVRPDDADSPPEGEEAGDDSDPDDDDD